MTEKLRALTSGLARTRQATIGRLAHVLRLSEIDDDTWDELEATLIQADLGVTTATRVVENLRQHVRAAGLTKANELQAQLRLELRGQLQQPPPLTLDGDPALILLVGVNGSGKTTTVVKLAKRLRDERGARPLLAACDTFRAAAVEQLQVWGERTGIDVVAGAPQTDPGAVLFDAVTAARARGANVVLADTAGRLHTKFNLMEELKKVHRVAGKASAGAPHHVLLVLDAITGQNALAQAQAFKQTVGVTGVIVTKLDSSARGGVIFAIREELRLPVQFIGLGESVDDLAPFDPDLFVSGLLDESFAGER